MDAGEVDWQRGLCGGEDQLPTARPVQREPHRLQGTAYRCADRLDGVMDACECGVMPDGRGGGGPASRGGD